ncbi:NKG2D ligand 2 [Myotis brandtii]|uniref:NKG2D ligand 2 n=1 Tax=Myotis brandtii TaxID=109478 RepID=S7QDD2_MYOBR|nr:NKG2D ligand 2 [Myotis brandtii]
MGEWCFGSFSSNPNPEQHFSFTDSYSLHYDFNISFNEQPWCMVQGQMDGEVFLSSECGNNKDIPINFLRDEGKATNSCKVMPTILNDVPEDIKELLPVIKQEEYPDGAASTTAIATVPSKAAMNMPIAWWICPVILTWITIVGFLGGSLQLQLLRAGLSGK